jgi:hypothetical protein
VQHVEVDVAGGLVGIDTRPNEIVAVLIERAGMGK